MLFGVNWMMKIVAALGLLVLFMIWTRKAVNWQMKLMAAEGKNGGPRYLSLSIY